MSESINTRTALERLKSISSRWYLIPEDLKRKKNKGGIGMLLERLIGLKNNNSPLDFSDGELKTISLKLLKNGKFQYKETSWITSKSNISDEDMIYKLKDKTKNMIFVPVFYDKLYLYICNPIVYTEKNEIHSEVIEDFSFITKDFNQHTTNGTYVQIRTKGIGGRNKRTYAYYFMKSFLSKVIPLPSIIPQNPFLQEEQPNIKK